MAPVMSDADSFAEVAREATRSSPDAKSVQTIVDEAELAKRRSNVDAALKIVTETGEILDETDAKTDRRLLRKVDLHIMPLICIVYFLHYIDKIAISYASVTGIVESTHLRGNQFNWVASILFFGYEIATHCW